MAGPTPITATHRITFSYTSGALAHVLKQYCQAQVDLLDSTGWGLIARGLLGVEGLSAAVDRVWTLLAPMFLGGSVSFNSAILEQRVGTNFVPVVTYNTAVVPTGGGQFGTAIQETFFFYSDDRTRHKFVILEGNYDALNKVSAPASLDTGRHAFVTAMTNTGSLSDPGAWLQSRDGHYIGSWLSWVTCGNRKTRRRRGIA